MSNIKVRNVVEGEISGITKYGVFVRLEDNYNGLIHISEISNNFVGDINKLYSIGSIINVKILDIDENKLQVKLSIKKMKNPSKQRNKKIIENGNGFIPLKEKMPEWIKNKMEEMKKSENK